jgi:hypothetical protein
MGPDFRADPVLERRNDLAARGVILGIGRKRHQHVQRQAHGVTLNLDVAFLQDVEEADLDFSREVRQLVDGEDPPIRPRQQSIVHRQLVGELEPGLRGLDRVDVADHVRNRHVWRCQLFDVARVALQPVDRRVVAFGRQPGPARGADGIERVIVDVTARHDRDLRVEQGHERAHQAGLRLAAQAEENEVVAGEQRVHQLRDHRVVVADDAGKERFAGAQLLNQVRANFLVHRPVRHVTALDRAAELANRGNLGSGHTGF